MKFIGDGGAADLFTALEDKRFESGFGQIECGDQAVVAAADDEDVAGVHREALSVPGERLVTAE
jgi:hypothetical protein